MAKAPLTPNRAAICATCGWTGHGRLETEAAFVSLAESQLALAALASLCAGEGTQ